jgi:hypothetical protein
MRPRLSLVVLALLLVAACGANPPPQPSGATESTPGATASAGHIVGPSMTSPPASTAITDGATPAPGSSSVPAAFLLPGFSLGTPPSDRSAWSVIEWRRLSPDNPLRLVTSITGWPGGYVALGKEVADTTDVATAIAARTPVWISTDGTTWTPLAPDALGPDSIILGVAAVPDGLVALTARSGPNQCEPGDTLNDGCFGTSPPVQSWTSADGLTWSANPGPFDTGEVPWFGADDRTLFAMATGGTAFEAAVSDDGVTWMALPADALPSTYTADSPAVFSTPSAILLAGGANLAGGRAGPLRASIPRSTEGSHWTSIRLPSTTPGVAETVRTIFVGRAGMIADGDIGLTPGVDLWWRSPDGIRWASVTGYPPLGARKSGEGAGNYPNGSLASDGTRIVAYRDRSTPDAWASFDGTNWTHLTMRGDEPARATFTLLPFGILAASDDEVWFGAAS